MKLGDGGPLKADGPGEFKCDECNARCTRNQETGEEYGHKFGCPNIPEKFKRSRSCRSDQHRYNPENVATDATSDQAVAGQDGGPR
jgi:hypothetical protein